MRKSSVGEKFAQVGMHLIMAFFTLICLYPVILTFMVSISSEKSVVDNGFQMIPKEFSMYAYEMIFRDKTIYSAYMVSILVTVIGTLLALLICGMAGYAMSVKRLKYRNFVSMYFYIPMVFGAGLVPWYLVCTRILHLQNTIWALILPMLVSPFNVFLMRNYFSTIPASLIESAEIDGCSVMGTFMKIVLPLSTPIVATVSLFIGLAYWNDWSHALWFVDNSKLYPLQYMLYRIEAIMEFIRLSGTLGGAQMPTQTYQVATLFVTIGPIILLYPFVQKYFVKGIMVGAVKE